MKEILVCLKAAVLSSAAVLLLAASLLSAGMDALDALFWMVVAFLGLYVMLLAVIEERRKI